MLLRVLLLLLIASAALSMSRAESSAVVQWERKLVVPGGWIEHAVFVTRDTAWAVGAGGVFVSGDGGRSWEHRFANDLLLNYADAAPDGQQGWAVGAIGAITATRDGGATWTAQDSNTDIHLTSVAAIDADSAIITGTGQGFSDVPSYPTAHILLRTDGGGETWYPFALPGGFVGRRVDFLPDGQHGWISAERCTPQPATTGCTELAEALFRTDDGGTTWTQFGDQPGLFYFEFVTPGVGWATVTECDTVCTSSALRSADGGATWDTVLSVSSNDGGLSAVHAIDAETAIAQDYTCVVEPCATAYHITRNGGVTWAPFGAPASTATSPTAFYDERRAVRFSPSEWTDDGTAWNGARFLVVAGSGAFDFVDRDHGWFAASELLRTDDGGEAWVSVSQRRFASLDFVSPSVGWATEFSCSFTCEGAVFKTADGGATWAEQLKLPDLQDAPSLTFVDSSNGWVVQTYGTGAPMWHTLDGGQTWREQRPPASDPYRAPRIAFVDRNIVWHASSACEPTRFDDCALRANLSTDGGDTWTATTPIPEEEDCGASSIAATSVKHVWISGSRCTHFVEPILHRSSDGGATWTSYDRGFVGDAGSLTFFDSRVGRSFSSFCPNPPVGTCTGAIYRTGDGGATWTREETDLLPSGVIGMRTQFLTPETIWQANQDGGGLVAVFRQSLHLYDGGAAGPAIIAPDTGVGQPSRSSPLPAAVALLSMGLVLLAVTMLASQRGVRRD